MHVPHNVQFPHFPQSGHAPQRAHRISDMKGEGGREEESGKTRQARYRCIFYA